jgi:biotin transport system substrate-specific component
MKLFEKKLNTRDICFIAIFTALTVVMAQISIPMPLGVPITMQTFAISIAGILLGPRKGFISALVYVLMGAIGVPVFAQFSGGLGIVIGPTGGFILSFPLMAWMIGLGAQTENKVYLALGLLAGTVTNFVCGMVMFSAITGNGLGVAFTACVLPFIPTTILKLAAAGVVGLKIRARHLIPAA